MEDEQRFCKDCVYRRQSLMLRSRREVLAAEEEQHLGCREIAGQYRARMMIGF